jgi:PAS domain-containing protein
VQAAPKRVLILDSFGRDVVPFNTVASACRTTLALELGEQVDIYSTSLDAAQLGEADKELADHEFLLAHLARRPVDLIIPVGAPAVRFAMGHREALFPTQPMVFTGLDPRNVRPEYLRTNTTMVAQAMDLRAAMEDILQLQPDTTNVVVVLGNSALERFWTAECRRDFAPFTNRLTIAYLNDQRLEEMERIVGALPPRSFVIYGMLIEDAAGIGYGQEAGLRRIRAAAKSPVYGCFGSQFGAGIIGGRLYQDEAVGRETARVAIRILRGERPEVIPPQLLEKAAPRYDWRELNRWGIRESVLPAGSVVSFRQPGFWEKYWGRTLLLLAFVLMQSSLIVGLLVSRRRQRRLETITSLLAELSTRFVNLPAAEVDRNIEQAQRRICECLGVETSGLWQWEASPPHEMILTHLHRPPNGPKAPARISAQEMFPWLLEQALKGKTVVIDTDDIPVTATRDLEARRRYGIKSSVLVPLVVGDQPILGVLTFNSLSAMRTWSKEIVLHLELIAQLFTNVLVRKSAEQSLRESELRLSLAADSAGVGLWEFDCRTQRFWATERTLSLFGFAATEVLSLPRFEQAIHPEDRDQFRQALDRASQHRESINVEYR